MVRDGHRILYHIRYFYNQISKYAYINSIIHDKLETGKTDVNVYKHKRCKTKLINSGEMCDLFDKNE